MLGLYSDTRTCFYTVAETFSKRWCSVTVGYITHRTIFVHYRTIRTSYRQCYVQKGTYYSDRACVYPDIILKYNTNRYAYTPEAEINQSIRTCLYVPGFQWLTYTIETASSITYIDEKKVFTYSYYISQREIITCVLDYSDRLGFVKLYNDNKLHSIEISSTIKTNSDRVCYWNIGGISQRFVIYTYQDFSEKQCLAELFQESILHTPAVQTTIDSLITERYVICGKGSAIDERLCYIFVTPFSDRYVHLKYRIISERYVSLYIGRMWRLYDFIVTPSDLCYTEKWCFMIPYANYSDRKVFCEMRELYEIKTPLVSTAYITVRDKKDEKSSIKIVSDRQLEYYGLSGIIEKLDKITMSKVIMQDKINILKISAVDNMGAAINTSGVNRKRELLETYTFEIEIIKT